MSVGTLPQRTRVVMHSAEAQHLKQSVPGRSAFESKRHATVLQPRADSRRLAGALDRAWWHAGEGEDRGCVVGLGALFDSHHLVEKRNVGSLAVQCLTSLTMNPSLGQSFIRSGEPEPDDGL